MIKLKSPLKRSGFALLAMSLLTGVSAVNLSLFAVETASAAQLTARSLTLSSTAPGSVTTGAANSYTNGSSARHTVAFTMGTSGATIGAIVLQYCTEAIGACTAPTGLSLASATKGTFSGTGITNGDWAVTSDNISTLSGRSGCTGTNGKTNCVVAVDSAPNTLTGTPSLSFAFETIQNPNETEDFYVRTYLYDDDAYAANSFGNAVDDGTVASAIVDPINITARVKERLGFSTTTADASNTSVTAEGTACDPLVGGGALTLGDAEGVLDAATQYNESSYFRVYTNAVGGVSIQYAGDTLKKGADDINALSSEVPGATGTEQFGFGIVNADDSIANTDDSHPGTAGTLTLAGGYDDGGAGTPQYNFAVGSTTTPVQIANSSGYVTCSTANVKYVANIATSTPAGTYTATITYYAVPTF